MPMNAFKADPSVETYTEEKCFITEIINSTGHPDVSVARARVEPGVTTALHQLKGIEEIYYVLQGEGRALIDGNEFDVKSGDSLMIPRNAPQQIENTGTQDLVFLCICTPRFTPDSYSEIVSEP